MLVHLGHIWKNCQLVRWTSKRLASEKPRFCISFIKNKIFAAGILKLEVVLSFFARKNAGIISAAQSQYTPEVSRFGMKELLFRTQLFSDISCIYSISCRSSRVQSMARYAWPIMALSFLWFSKGNVKYHVTALETAQPDPKKHFFLNSLESRIFFRFKKWSLWASILKIFLGV